MKKIIIGLTGQSGAGKTIISSMFEQEGFNILNADEISRDIINTNDVLNKLAITFGQNIIEDGILNRKNLANIVFSNKEKLMLLNSIMFPLVKEKINLEINKSSNQFILLDAPQLFEAEANKMCDYIVSVIAPKEKLIERIMQRDNINEQEASNRLSSQYNQDFFITHSDFIINNNCTIGELYHKVKNIIKTIKTKDQT